MKLKRAFQAEHSTGHVNLEEFVDAFGTTEGAFWTGEYFELV